MFGLDTPALARAAAGGSLLSRFMPTGAKVRVDRPEVWSDGARTCSRADRARPAPKSRTHESIAVQRGPCQILGPQNMHRNEL